MTCCWILSKTEKELDWKTQVSFEEDLNKTFDWYTKNPKQ